jgi:hypothetical protein
MKAIAARPHPFFLTLAGGVVDEPDALAAPLSLG